VTTDFFTPVVDDPYDFGGIAAANALSDVYAMGGKPFLALNIAALPNDLPMEIGAAILRGGADKAKEAGIPVAGGHTIQDKEPKYGLVVLGFADPRKLLSKQGARVGDLLYITKPLGFGVTNTAVKRELATPQDEHEVVGWMRKLNKQASELAQEFELRGGTDITGFGLLGHAWEMTSGASVKLKIYFDAIPFTSGATMYAKQDTFPGGSRDNRNYYSPHIDFAHDIENWEQLLLFDAQTSGGLLLAVPAERSTAFEARAADVGQPMWRIGEVTLGTGIEVDRKVFD
jgi:selenide,water dikinase